MASAALAGGYLGYEVGFEAGKSAVKAENPGVTTTVAQEQVVGRFVISEVTDGDTVKVQVGDTTATIRILGINAPESRPNQGRPVQCFAKEATAEASRLLMDRTVELSIDPIADSQDSNGRLLRKIDMDESPQVEDFSRAMVENGFAAAYRGYPTTDRRQLIALEQAAREDRRGLWGSCRIPSGNIPTNLSTEVTFPPARP